jgi:hypothetical protein
MPFKPRGKPKPKGIHVFIATPAYDGKVESDYSQSLAETTFCCPLYSIQVSSMVTGNGAFIELSRNIFVKRFLEMEEFKDCTHLFFIDADLKWEARAFIGLLQADLPICAGIYPRRQDPMDYPFAYAENPEGGGLWFKDDWLQCRRVPTGFLCIKREILEEMAKDAPKIKIAGQEGPVPWVFHTSFDGSYQPVDGAAFIGEDYGFCDDYMKKYGEPISVWANFDFTHGRRWKGNLFEHLTEQKKAHDDKQAADQSAAA